jgi:hypothetical protein
MTVMTVITAASPFPLPPSLSLSPPPLPAISIIIQHLIGGGGSLAPCRNGQIAFVTCNMS